MANKSVLHYYGIKHLHTITLHGNITNACLNDVTRQDAMACDKMSWHMWGLNSRDAWNQLAK